MLEPNMTPGLGDPGIDDAFQLQLYGSQSVGVYDLSAGVEANFETCTVCARVFEDPDSMGSPVRQYFQSKGTVEFTAVGADISELAGTVSGLELVEVTIDDNTLVSTPVPNGECLTVMDGSFDTIP